MKREEGQQRFRNLHATVSELLRQHDPLDLIASGAPNDEYEPEVSAIIPRLREARGNADVRALVHEEFVRWFDAETAGAPSRYEDLANRIWNAWVEFRAKS